MINELQTAKSGNFYKIHKPLTRDSITQLFRNIRASHTAPSNNHFLHIRQKIPAGTARFSAICFKFDRRPTFLESSAIEKVYGYLFLVEYLGHLAVFKSQLDLPATFVTNHLENIGAEVIDNCITKKESVFGKVRLRNMTVSKFALRSKTLEAENLENTVGLASSRQFAPVTYSVQTNGEHYSTTTRTGRISQRSDRIGHTALVEYARELIDRMTGGAIASTSFLSMFARPQKLSSISAVPATFAFDVMRLQTALLEDRDIRLVRFDGGQWNELSAAEVHEILSALGNILSFTGIGTRLDLHAIPGGPSIGSISINKSRIALRSLNITSLVGIEVERSSSSVGEDTLRSTFCEFINRNDAFLIIFDNPSFAYIEGTLYKDDAITNGGHNFLKYLFENSELNPVADEKGTFAPTQKAFASTSTFAVVIDALSHGDDLLVCDDLGDEWADFIGIQTNPLSPRLTFYHAKHGVLSLGASPFHVSVSQAIKNLGRLALSETDMPTKFEKWQKTYYNDGVQTQISRLCRGNSAVLETTFSACRTAPHVMKRIAIVTSSLSKIQVEKTFNAIQAGARPDPHFVQLYWLLSSFFAACAEVGAVGCVMCRP